MSYFVNEDDPKDPLVLTDSAVDQARSELAKITLGELSSKDRESLARAKQYLEIALAHVSDIERATTYPKEES